MIIAKNERGAALLSVMLLIAVIATVASTTLDRVGLATKLARNAATLAQARSWLDTTEVLYLTRIEDLAAADQSQTTLAGGWLGGNRRLVLPDGAIVRTRLYDGGNCFNLNSLVEWREHKLTARAAGVRQFSALMVLLGIPEGEATRISQAATAYLAAAAPSLQTPPEAREGERLLMADASELRAVPGVGADHFALLERWICALPTTELAPINVNTLLPEQAVLLAMLDREQVDLNRARAQLESRPAGGYGSVFAFWNAPALKDIVVSPEAQQQVRVKTSFFTLRAEILSGDIKLAEIVQIDVRGRAALILRRNFGGEGES